jgi:hypothetical protein
MQVKTEEFFLGSSSQFISGSQGNIEISSSEFHLQRDGDVIVRGDLDANSLSTPKATIDANGFATFTSASIAAFTIDDTSITSKTGTLNLKSTGQITGSQALLTGGTIGGWTIASDKIYAGSNQTVGSGSFTSASGDLIISSSGAIYSNKFYIGSDGSARLDGLVSASEGNIAGWRILDKKLASRITQSRIELSSSNEIILYDDFERQVLSIREDPQRSEGYLTMNFLKTGSLYGGYNNLMKGIDIIEDQKDNIFTWPEPKEKRYINIESDVRNVSSAYVTAINIDQNIAGQTPRGYGMILNSRISQSRMSTGTSVVYGIDLESSNISDKGNMHIVYGITSTAKNHSNRGPSPLSYNQAYGLISTAGSSGIGSGVVAYPHDSWGVKTSAVGRDTVYGIYSEGMGVGERTSSIDIYSGYFATGSFEVHTHDGGTYFPKLIMTGYPQKQDKYGSTEIYGLVRITGSYYGTDSSMQEGRGYSSVFWTSGSQGTHGPHVGVVNLYVGEEGRSVETTEFGTFNDYGKIYADGDCVINGALSKGSGGFKIIHPDPVKSGSYKLIHSFVESPTEGDNIYRWQKTFISGSNIFDLPDYYKFLNKNDMVWVSPVDHFGRGYGKTNESQTQIEVIVDTSGTYNILLIGTRKDLIASKNWGGVEVT